MMHPVNLNLEQFAQVAYVLVMVDEPKDVRLPLMVTRSEATAIDEWRYAQRIPTRAEAIRQLIQAGLKTKPGVPPGYSDPGGPGKSSMAAAPRRARKATQDRKAAPAAPTSKEAQLRALREQGAR
jgi:hypothetical protein